MKRLMFLLAGIALFVGVADMPYVYYLRLRWVVCILGAYGACLSFGKSDITWGWALAAIALIFNPIAKFFLEKQTWQIVELVSGVIFCAYSRKA